jgi:hypothetical protein
MHSFNFVHSEVFSGSANILNCLPTIPILYNLTVVMHWVLIIGAIAAGTNSAFGLSARSYGPSAGYNKMRTVSSSTTTNAGDSFEPIQPTAGDRYAYFSST